MIACQSEITNPLNRMECLSTSVISSLFACIFTGFPRPSSVQSTLENDGITVRTLCLVTAGQNGASASLSKVARSTSVDPLVDG